MEHEKDNIKILLGNKEARYKPVLDFVDKRWKEQLDQPFHAAGFLLNPHFNFQERYKLEENVGKFEVGCWKIEVGFITCGKNG